MYAVLFGIAAITMSHTLTLAYETLLQAYENRFSNPVFPGSPEGLYKPVEHIMRIKGKRIRPLLLLVANDVFGGNTEKALGPAYAVEVFHNFTLVHDDIMDNAPLRRGIPTVHEVFGNSQAILSGDVMLSYAYRYLAEGDPASLAQLLSCFTQTAIEVMEGQQLDMDFENRTNVSEAEYLEMIRLKTSVLLACSLKLGSIVAGASEADQQKIYDFGINLGLSFQIKDDYLDAYGDHKKVGKKTGGDIVNNKKTFLLIAAFNHADAAQKDQLIALLNETDEQKKISGVLNIYQSLGIAEKTLNRSEELYHNALDQLHALSISEEQKKPLLELAEMVYNRDF